MNSVSLGNPFFIKHKITVDIKNNLLQLPDLTVELNQVLPEKSKKQYTKNSPKIHLTLPKKVQIGLHMRVLLECTLAKPSDQYQSCTGLIIPSDHLKDKRGFVLTSSLSKIEDAGKVFVPGESLSENQITLINQSEIPHFKILNEAKADNLIEFDPQLISLAKMCNSDDFAGELNQFNQDFHFIKVETPTGHPPLNYSKLWFPTPETCNDFF